MAYRRLKIIVIVPAYNEEKSIGKVIEKIPKYIDEILVVNDGSDDDTSRVARHYGASVINHPINKGVGSAFDTGRTYALTKDFDLIVNIDADDQFNPQDIEKLILPIIAGEADFVSASRFKDKEFVPKMSRLKYIGNRMMSYLISKIVNRRFYDVSCGFRAYSREAIMKLNLFGEFTYTQETFLYLAFKNMRILEIPVKVRGTREIGKSRISNNVIVYAYQTLKIIIKTLRDYKPLKLFGALSVMFCLIGSVLLLFLLAHYIRVGMFTPHKWAGLTGGFFIMLSIINLAIGFILDMFTRMRWNQEEIIYKLNKEYDVVRNK